MDNQGQLSADFLFAALILIIIIGALTNIVSSGIDTANDAQISEAKADCEKVAEAINSVYTNGDGHYVIVNLTSDIDYTLMVNNASISTTSNVAVNYKNKTAVSYLVPKSANINQVTMKPNDTYKISNANGIINFQKMS